MAIVAVEFMPAPSPHINFHKKENNMKSSLSYTYFRDPKPIIDIIISNTPKIIARDLPMRWSTRPVKKEEKIKVKA